MTTPIKPKKTAASLAKKARQKHTNYNVENVYADVPLDEPVVPYTSVWVRPKHTSMLNCTVDEFSKLAKAMWKKAMILKIEGPPKAKSEKWEAACVSNTIIDSHLCMFAERLIRCTPKRGLLNLIEASRHSETRVVEGGSATAVDVVTGARISKPAERASISGPGGNFVTHTKYLPFIDRMCVLYHLPMVLETRVLESIKALNEGGATMLASYTAEQLVEVLTEDDPGMKSFCAYLVETLEILHKIAMI